VLDHATTELAMGGKMGIDATHKLPGEGHKRGWPPVIRMTEEVKSRVSPIE
jgi:4-hydroxy-3-polyprenylbenzoate decarboxylase